MNKRRMHLVTAAVVVLLVLVSVPVGVRFIHRDVAGPQQQPAEKAVVEVAQQEAREEDTLSALESCVASVSEPSWHLIGRWSGSGPKQTPRFATTGSEWRISWKTLNGSPVSGGCFSVTVYTDAGDFVSLAANNVGARSAVSYVQAPAGKFFLAVSSFCQSWEVDVEELAAVYGTAESAGGDEVG